MAGSFSAPGNSWLERLWFQVESRRRRRFGPTPTANLLSYPRSGSHLLRVACEKLSGNPTLGDGDDQYSDPLWPPDWPPLLRSSRLPWAGAVRAPFLQKVHYANPAEERLTFALNNQQPHVFLLRDPVQALSSHLRLVPKASFQARLEEEVNRFDLNIRYVRSLNRSQWVLVRYEDLLVSPRREALRVLDFLRVPARPLPLVTTSDAAITRLGLRATRRSRGDTLPRELARDGRLAEIIEIVSHRAYSFDWLASLLD